MRQQGRVVGKVELRDHVWDGPGEDGNVVEVYVGYLRRKLGRDAVLTVRGVGYRVAG
jgi:DNA-binding response OmpR family regulator